MNLFIKVLFFVLQLETNWASEKLYQNNSLTSNLKSFKQTTGQKSTLILLMLPCWSSHPCFSCGVQKYLLSLSVKYYYAALFEVMWMLLAKWKTNQIPVIILLYMTVYVEIEISSKTRLTLLFEKHKLTKNTLAHILENTVYLAINLIKVRCKVWVWKKEVFIVNGRMIRAWKLDRCLFKGIVHPK